MAGITRRNVSQPDDSFQYGEHGEAAGVAIGETDLWRSTLLPGWSWDAHVKPYAGGATSCPMYHHEFVISGRIRYLMEDGTELVAEPGDHLFIEPGHRAWVIGEEPCELIDW